jgi:hypothetical protein
VAGAVRLPQPSITPLPKKEDHMNNPNQAEKNELIEQALQETVGGGSITIHLCDLHCHILSVNVCDFSCSIKVL